MCELLKQNIVAVAHIYVKRVLLMFVPWKSKQRHFSQKTEVLTLPIGPKNRNRRGEIECIKLTALQHVS